MGKIEKNNTCVVPQCFNKLGPSVSMHEFPRKKELFEKWSVFCKKKNVKNSGNLKICSAHFKPECFASEEKLMERNHPIKRLLKENAIPTISVSELVEDFELLDPTTKRCRVCLTSGKNLLEMFDTNEFEPSYADKILQCVKIELEKNDDFPKNICKDCVSLLENVWKFKLLLEKSNEALQLEKLVSPLSNEPKVCDELFQKNNEMKLESDSEFCDENDNQSKSDYIEEELSHNKDSVNQSKKKKKKRKYHPREKKHQCEECGFLTGHPYQLADHKRFVHEGIAIYKCNECPKSFPKDSILKSHIRVVHTINPVVCDLCGKSFKNPPGLYKHRRGTHPTEKKFQCQYCPYKAVDNCVLKKHMYVHSGLRKYECDTCGKFFITPSARKRHIRIIHDQIRAFKCDQCEKSFKTAYMLKKHEVVHTGWKPFKCPHCPSSSYSWYVGLTTHQRSAHPELKLEKEGVMYKKFILEMNAANSKVKS